jgi:hypothetical protein
MRQAVFPAGTASRTGGSGTLCDTHHSTTCCHRPNSQLEARFSSVGPAEGLGHGGVEVGDELLERPFPPNYPVAFLRDSLAQRGFAPCSVLRDAPDGRGISVAGLILVRQMPGSAKGVMFMTLEDESANANIIVWPSVFEKKPPHHPLGRHARLPGQGSARKRRHPPDRGKRLRSDGGPQEGLRKPLQPKPRDIYVPDLHIDTLKPKSRNFR